jgi:hypothetical protein
MADHPSIADWITATSTALTAIAAGVAGFIAWLAFRRDTLNRLPIIETDIEFESQYRVLNLTITNRLPETIVVTSAIVRKPKGSLISAAFRFGQHGYVEVMPPNSNEANLKVEVEAAGSSIQAIPGMGVVGDVKKLPLYILPPKGWMSGDLVVDLSISSKARTLRDKRIVIRRFTAAPPPKENSTPRGGIQIPS